MSSGRGGRRPGAGRPKGSPSKRSQKIEDRLNDLECDPIEGMARIAMMAELDAQSESEAKSRLPHLTLAKDCYKELAQYVAPKRKAVEMEATVGIGVHEAWLERLRSDKG